MPFVKGDPRINRNGRPKSFDKLRELAQLIAAEEVTPKDAEEAITRVEDMLRKMTTDNPERFLEIAYGKVPQAIDLTNNGKDLPVPVTVIEIIKSKDE